MILTQESSIKPRVNARVLSPAVDTLNRIVVTAQKIKDMEKINIYDALELKTTVKEIIRNAGSTGSDMDKQWAELAILIIDPIRDTCTPVGGNRKVLAVQNQMVVHYIESAYGIYSMNSEQFAKNIYAMKND